MQGAVCFVRSPFIIGILVLFLIFARHLILARYSHAFVFVRRLQKKQMKLMFRATDTDAIIAWVTADFQLYVQPVFPLFCQFGLTAAFPAPR